MKEIILCKYGEMALKGLNKCYFEKQLVKELKMRLALAGDFAISHAQSTLYIVPQNDDCDMDYATDLVLHVFGIVSVSRAAEVEKDIDAIIARAKEYVPRHLAGAKTFKVESKRSDKHFPLNSPQISAAVGAAVLETVPHIKVDVNNPDVKIVVEVRDSMAYIHAGSMKGAGGMPTGTNGKGLLLLSGGIDSPVAGYMMAKRGLHIESLHFESYPYTSEQARDKTIELARRVSLYGGKMFVHVISLTRLQEELRDRCDEEYFTLLLRRSMMRLAQRCATRYGAGALITGESLGQVASQTIMSIGVTDPAASLPVFRPCIGMDKEEIVSIARRIDTFETSILPYEDCCTVFTPRHPNTRPELSAVLEQEKKLDLAALEDEAYAGMRTWRINPFDSTPEYRDPYEIEMRPETASETVYLD